MGVVVQTLLREGVKRTMFHFITKISEKQRQMLCYCIITTLFTQSFFCWLALNN